MSLRRARIAVVAGATLFVASACHDERTLRAGTDEDARAAAQMLRRMGLEAEAATRPVGSVRVPGPQAAAAEALLADTGFAFDPAPDDAPLVAGPSESARRARESSGRALEAALRGLPGVLNAKAVVGPAGAAVFVWHPAEGPPGPAVTDAARAVFGPTVQVVSTPVAARVAPASTSRSLEVPLALSSLVLAVALVIVARRRRPGGAG